MALKDAVIFSLATLCFLLVFIKSWMETKQDIKKKYNKNNQENTEEKGVDENNNHIKN
jgi:hypothetical protein